MEVVILEGFTGFPGGKKRAFAEGETVCDLTKTYAAMLVSKRLARKKTKRRERADASQ